MQDERGGLVGRYASQIVADWAKIESRIPKNEAFGRLLWEGVKLGIYMYVYRNVRVVNVLIL